MTPFDAVCFYLHRVLYYSISKIKLQNNTETVHREATYIILFLTRYNKSINDNKNGDLYTSSPCLTRSGFVLLMTSHSIADDVTMIRQL